MKRNFLTAVALMVVAFLASTTVAQAADVTFSGHLWPRYEVNEQSDMRDSTDADFWAAMRTRLNANVKVDADTSAFISLQSVRTFGNNLGAGGGANARTGANAAATNSSAGGANGPFSPNDQDDSVGVHQAYMYLKNFAGLPVDLKLGRQEVVLDGHRLFGNTLWTMGASSHDALLLVHARDNHTLIYGYSTANEDSTLEANTGDVDAHILYGNFQGVLGGALSTYGIIVDDRFGSLSGGTTNANNAVWFTLGARQAGKLAGLDYRVEYYHQLGQAAASNALGQSGIPAGVSVDTRDAYMYGARVSKTFSNTMWKPKITLFYDFLSGTSDDDVQNGNWRSFDTLFDTGHKFYGLMDEYLSNTGGDQDFFGMQDLSVKLKLQPAANWKFMADWHQFYTAVGINGSPTRANAAGFTMNCAGAVGALCAQGVSNPNRNYDTDLGQEVDLTLVHKYSSNVTLQAGYSVYYGTPTHAIVKERTATAGGEAQWAYLQASLKF